MSSFFENVPPEYVPELRTLIESLRETQAMIQQVQKRFGTDQPDALRELMGQEFDGVTVTEESVEELKILQGIHEERREAIRSVFNRIGGKAESNPPTELD